MKDFILEIPKWEGEIVFSAELVNLLLVIVVLGAGILLCFWGYRYFTTIALVLLGCLCGVIGYRIGADMTQNPVLQMCIFVMFMFLGVCLFYFLSILWSWTLDRLGIQAFVQRTLHIIAAVAGALVVGIVTYMNVYRNLLVVIIIAAVLVAAGIWYALKSVKAKRVFHTYDDLIRLKPFTEEKADA